MKQYLEKLKPIIELSGLSNRPLSLIDGFLGFHPIKELVYANQSRFDLLVEDLVRYWTVALIDDETGQIHFFDIDRARM